MEEQAEEEQTETYIDKGERLIEQGDFDSAIGVYTGAISRKPKDGFIYFLRGDAFRKKGDFDRAIADYTKAISISNEPQPETNGDGSSLDDEDRAMIYIYRAIAYISKSDYHNVIADANEAIKTGHFLDNAYLARGKAYYNLGPMGQAFEDWKTAANHGSKGALIELEKYGIKYTPLKKP